MWSHGYTAPFFYPPAQQLLVTYCETRDPEMLKAARQSSVPLPVPAPVQLLTRGDRLKAAVRVRVDCRTPPRDRPFTTTSTSRIL